MPTAVPPHEPEYQWTDPPVPAPPPLRVRAVPPPLHVGFTDADADDGLLTFWFTVTVTA